MCVCVCVLSGHGRSPRSKPQQQPRPKYNPKPCTLIRVRPFGADVDLECDDPKHMQWLYETSLKRAVAHGIEGALPERERERRGERKTDTVLALVCAARALPHAHGIQGLIARCLCVNACCGPRVFEHAHITYALCHWLAHPPLQVSRSNSRRV